MSLKPGAWLRDHFLPTVLVAGSPQAEALVFSKNGLQLVDLLRPFHHLQYLDGKCRGPLPLDSRRGSAWITC